MTSRLKRNAPLLKLLCRAKPALVKAIIKAGDRDLINTLCECSLNVLKGNVRLAPAQKKKLARHKQTLRLLSKKNTSLQRRKALLQTGGFLPLLLKPVVVSFLGGLLGSLIS